MTSAMATAAVAAAAAIVGAVLVLAITHAVTGEWRLLEFSQDLIRNVLIAGFVAVGTVFINQSRRREEEQRAFSAHNELNRRRVLRWHRIMTLAATAWNELPCDEMPDPTDPATVDALMRQLQDSTDDLRSWATEIEGIHAASGGDAEQETRARIGLTTLSWTLLRYAAEGQRARRFARLEYLASELAGLDDDVDAEWSQSVDEFRRAAPVAIGWRSHTDATIVERLLVEQHVSGGTMERQTKQARDLRARAALDSAATTLEPVNLLIVFVSITVNLTATGSNEPWNVINRCLGSLRNEMRMVAAAYDALVPVLEVARRHSSA